MSGLKASAIPVINKLPPKRYIGHSHPSASGFSPGLIPHSQPDGGSNWDSLPWPPPCRRAVTERDLIVAGWRTQRTARRRAPACLIMAISKGEFFAASGGSKGRGRPQWFDSFVTVDATKPSRMLLILQAGRREESRDYIPTNCCDISGPLF